MVHYRDTLKELLTKCSRKGVLLGAGAWHRIHSMRGVFILQVEIHRQGLSSDFFGIENED